MARIKNTKKTMISISNYYIYDLGVGLRVWAFQDGL